MTFVVTDACIRCKYMDCVSVCPVDCFREGRNMLVIDPDECIDCGACWGQCPANAIEPDSERGMDRWIALNAEFAPRWPRVVRKDGQTPDDSDVHKGAVGKFEKFFSPEAGAGNWHIL